jgi:5-methylthioadenosine/S-adenosylhomocysteine deaminase
LPETIVEQRPDALVVHGTVVTMNRDREIIENGALALAGGQIAEVGFSTELLSRWPAVNTIDAKGGLVIPGLVNAHQHATGDPLLWSAIPDVIDSQTAIFEWAVPVHAAERAEDEELSAVLVGLASVLCGVTTLVEAGTVAYPDSVAAGLLSTGIRAGVGVWGWDVGSGPLVAPAAVVLERIGCVLERFPVGGRVEGWVTLVGHDLVSDELLTGAAELARSRSARMTMHLSPTTADPESYLRERGARPFVHLHNLGVLGPHLLVAHGVWIDDAEAEAIVASRTALAYCPSAYLRLGQGVSRAGRHAEIFREGGRVALGCDSTNAGDAPDILRQAALAAGLAKDMRADPTWFGAHDAFELATIAGAEAIGMADRIGSLEVGKQADVVIIDTSGPAWAVPGDPIQKIVWSASGGDVRDVLVAGTPVVRDGRSTLVDEEEVAATAGAASRALADRAGLSLPTRWPWRREGAEL